MRLPSVTVMSRVIRRCCPGSLRVRLAAPRGWGEDTSPVSCRSRQQLGQPDQIESRTREHEEPIHLLEAAEFDFPHPGDRLQPAKRRFDARSRMLTHRVARMPGRAAVDRAASGPIEILGDMRSVMVLTAASRQEQICPCIGAPRPISLIRQR